MRIVGGEAGNFIEIGDVDAAYLLAPNAGQLPSPSITMAKGNLLVEGYMYPNKLVDPYQYPELTPMYHPYIALGAAALLGMEEPTDSAEFAQAKAYMDQFASSISTLSSYAKIQAKGRFQMQSKRR